MSCRLASSAISPFQRATPRTCWLLSPLMTTRETGPLPCSCRVIEPSNFSVAVSSEVATSSSPMRCCTAAGYS
ncbi:Uncharacterised protein [Vibrio cholerae]|nr:Uncharacterised protein [Vibrio cholerae]CSI45911.1 Uncharacterised protein [Vibrio cholerae]